MKILAFSDLHGILPNYAEYSADIALIAGDSVPLNIQFDVFASIDWYNTSFRSWCESLNVTKVLFIAGNHDKACEEAGLVFKQLFPFNQKVTYLEDESYEFISQDGEMATIYGTPWCRQFFSWSFMASKEELTEKYSHIPEGIDIVLTHDVPYDVNDVILQPTQWNTYEHIGNVPLRNALLEKHPKYNISGHLHAVTKLQTKLESTTCINCSVLDEYYKLTFLPQRFEL